MKGNKCFTHISKTAGFLTVVLLFFFFKSAHAEESELGKVKEQKKLHQQNLEKQNKAAASMQKELESAEKEIAKFAAKLQANNEASSEAEKTLDKLKISAEKLEQDRQAQQKLLANQIASAYRTGQHDYLKVLLNQEDPSKIDRAISYYQYLNKARIKSLQKMQHTLTELEANQQQQANKLTQLQRLKTEHVEQQKKLAAQQSGREQAMAALNKTILSEQQQIKQLEDAEKQLVKQVTASIEKQRIQQEQKKVKKPMLDGLNKYRGKLNWPVKGSVMHQFGGHRSGQLRWKGMLISAAEGADIRALSHGQVVYSDYLKGYGMVMVIDHGHGYMSLYGHNQTLLKSVGETVRSQEVIALAGRSGGQQRSGLYFEIRYEGKPQDPRKWLSRR